ncbi:amidohydrolase family protein [Terriglobus albidus]|uniref:amidohydrolase family protein n=1 Tax=Terriglobus albidus TaxID=1592106 RepID=UPI001C9C1176|nr:amidohydrolase family protein [Terriglobus albidus]
MAWISRRRFVGSAVTVAAARVLQSQSPSTRSVEWGSPVIDCHFHQRPTLEANLAHLNGSGCQAAYLLSRLQSADDAKRFLAGEPTRFAGYSVSTDVTAADAVKLLTEAVKAGAHGFGEVKFHVDADGPEMRRLYAAAAELNVPVTIHFQEVPHTPTEGVFNTGFKRFDKILKEFPKTTFVGHCDAFWANVSADYANDKDYPRTPIIRGGITDKWLGDYPNLFGDLSANSGNNALTRDPSFTAYFLSRHQHKLFFGSDCACTDGHGGGVSQQGNPGAARLAGKCVARETLAVLKANASPDLFHDLVWSNGHKVYGLTSLS